MMKVSINKNPILVEIMFSSNITWNHCNFGSKVHLEYLGLPTNTYVLTKQSVVYFYDSVKSLYSIGQCNYRFQLSTTNNNTFGWPAEKYKREKTWQTMEQEYYSHLSNNVMPLSQSLGWLAEQWISCSSCLQHLCKSIRIESINKLILIKRSPIGWNEAINRTIPTEGYAVGLFWIRCLSKQTCSSTPERTRPTLLASMTWIVSHHLLKI